MPDLSNVASVISTGGSGTTFEHLVGTSFLTLLLTQSYLPIHVDSIATSVAFQARRLDWHVDDLVVTGTDEHGQARKLCIQAKLSLTVSVNDDECRKTIAAAWADFNNAELFEKDRDAIVLAVHLGTNRLLRDFGWLLEQSRASSSSEDFLDRRSRDGLLSSASKGDYDTVAEIICDQVAGPTRGQDVWAFLRALHVMSFDLLGDASKDKAAMLSLLNFMRSEDSPARAAHSTWNELFSAAASAAGKGQTFERASLPADALRWHRTAGSVEQGALARLRQHSDVVLRRIDDSGIPGLRLPRDDLRAALDAAAAGAQFVLLTGAAGSGKSALAKRRLASGRGAWTAFAFAAEEFAVPHMDQVLAHGQIGMNWQTLKALFPLGEKLFLIDGLERLLESDDRAALVDLLGAAVDDPSIRLLATCRDHHAELVERSLLEPSGVTFERVSVPGLSDAETDDAAIQLPRLASLFSIPSLRDLLRNPFLLSRAAKLDWVAEGALPQNERALRERMWSELARREALTRDNLPNRRSSALVSIALRRARSLQPYIELAASDDGVAIEALVVDNLVVYDGSLRTRCAPAHDVFEDWALVVWLSDQFAVHADDALAFARAVGVYPALRRAYRKWLVEMLETEPARTAPYVAAIATDPSAPDFFRDDTLVAVFQSSKSAPFLGLISAELLDDGARLIRRIIGVVRVACKAVAPESPKAAGAAFRLHVPAGDAWRTLVEYLAAERARLPVDMHRLVLDLLEDWAQGIRHDAAYPPGFEAAGFLARCVFDACPESYGERGAKQRAVALLARVPKAAPELLQTLAAKTVAGAGKRSRDQNDKLMLAPVLQPFQSFALCRDFPELVESVCLSAWALDEETRSEMWHRETSIDIDVHFGMERSYEHRLFPPSAFQGPFHSLLRLHPARAIKFIAALLNDASSHFFTAPRSFGREPPEAERVAIVLADGERRELWRDARLWNAYRGLSVMPDPLVCALMALEKWLLELLALNDADVDRFALDALDLLLARSNNVSLISVVASVCMAHPGKTAAASLCLLGTKEFFELDRARMVQEASAPAIGGSSGFDHAFQRERMESNALPHRGGDLERLAIDLQMSGKATDTQALIDRHRAAIPDLDAQSEEDLLWRLALDRMDLRKYEVKEVDSEGSVQIGMSAPPQDIQRLLDEKSQTARRFEASLSLFLWARGQFDRDARRSEDAQQWPERLAAAQVARAEPLTGDMEERLWQGGPNTVAAVCIRDRWLEMDEAQRAWCADAVFDLIELPLHAVGDSELHAKKPMSGVADCAFVAPMLASLGEARQRARSALVCALCHFNEDARLAAARGVSAYIVGANAELERLAVAALSAYAEEMNAQVAQWKTLASRGQQRPSNGALFGLCLKAALGCDGSLKFNPVSRLSTLGFATWEDRAFARSLLEIYRGRPQERAAVALFEAVGRDIPRWWERESERHFEFEHVAVEALVEFALASQNGQSDLLMAPIVGSVASHPEDVAKILRQAIFQESRQTEPTTFWRVWSSIVSALLAAPWIGGVKSMRSPQQSLLRQVFFGVQWAAGLRKWERLGNRFKEVDDLFIALPASGLVLECYAYYLRHVGEASLPGAFALIANKFPVDLGEAIGGQESLRFYLEELASRCLYEDSATIRRSATLRGGMILVLDGLVAAGSPLGFQLRDDFVTTTATAYKS